MRYLTLNEVLRLYDMIIQKTGGSSGIRDYGALQNQAQRLAIEEHG